MVYSEDRDDAERVEDIDIDERSEHGSSGDTVQLFEAIHQIHRKAAGRPLVINQSLGTNFGPHDGTTMVEQAIDSLVSEPGAAVAGFATRPVRGTIARTGRVAGFPGLERQ